MKKYALALGAALSLIIVAGTQSVSAQLENPILTTIEFPFSADNTTLPPGKYTITRVDQADPTILELRSEDGKTAVIFKGTPVQSTSTPSKTELTFKKYGDQEVLSQIWEEGVSTGIEIPTSRAEQRIAKGGASPQKHSVAASKKK